MYIEQHDQHDHAEAATQTTETPGETTHGLREQTDSPVGLIERMEIPADHPVAQILRRIFGDGEQSEQPDQNDQDRSAKVEGVILPADMFRDVAAILWLYTCDLFTRLGMETEGGPIHQVMRQNALAASQGNTGASIAAWIRRITAIGRSLDGLADRNQVGTATVDGLHVPPF